MIRARYIGVCPVCGHELARTRPDPEWYRSGIGHDGGILLDLATGQGHDPHDPDEPMPYARHPDAVMRGNG